MQYKVSPINALWSPKDGPPIWLWLANDSSHPKLPQTLPNHVPFCPTQGNDATKSIDKEKLSMAYFLNMWSFGRWGVQGWNLCQKN
jgi:hypothetical protein